MRAATQPPLMFHKQIRQTIRRVACLGMGSGASTYLPYVC